LLAVATLPQVVRTQKRSCAAESLKARLEYDKTLALAYAPVFWFSPGERYFPTLPFFPPFDSAGRHFGNPMDIAPGSGEILSWNKLDGLYNAGNDTTKARQSAIFYRVRKLDDGQRKIIIRYLKSDEQAWNRLIRRTLRDSLEKKDTGFQVIEYYAYYLNDLGVVGHPHDIEFVYVFLPQDPALAQRFNIVVGAGHTDRTPNNVLVSTGSRSGVIVELGDHSSAPDLPPYGTFTPGYDANWHPYDVWGTRDLQATAGLAAFGPYALAMTFPRTAMNSVRLFPPVTPESLMARWVGSGEPEDSVGWRRFRYSLAPAEVFECLHDRLDRRTRPPADTREIESLMSVMDSAGVWTGSKGSDGLSPAGFGALSAATKDTAVAYMRRWNDGLRCESPHCKVKHGRISPADYQPWMHPQYRGNHPTDVFKQHLFRPVLGAASVWTMTRYWVTWLPGNAAFLEAGFEAPAWRDAPIRLPGYLEVRGGAYMKCRYLFSSCWSHPWSPVATLQYTGHYNQPFTFYLRYSWIFDRRKIDGDTAATSTLGGGVSIVPASLHWPNVFPIHIVCSLRVRIGLATGVHRTGPRLGDARLEIQFSSLRPLGLPAFGWRNPACA